MKERKKKTEIKETKEGMARKKLSKTARNMHKIESKRKQNREEKKTRRKNGK